MRKSALATLLLAAALAFAYGAGSAGFAQLSVMGWNWPANLGKASLLGGGMLPAFLFGGSFAGLLLALIVGGCIGMARNVSPKPPKARKSQPQIDAAASDQLRMV